MPAITAFLADRLPAIALLTSTPWNEKLASWFMNHWEDFIEWASQPHVIYAALAWLITFYLVVTLILGMGFGPAGIVAGSFAAGFQGLMYGGFTPAGGIFAALTSMGMLGMLMPAAVIVAVVWASVVAGVGGIIFQLRGMLGGFHYLGQEKLSITQDEAPGKLKERLEIGGVDVKSEGKENVIAVVDEIFKGLEIVKDEGAAWNCQNWALSGLKTLKERG
ncbi:hypothetical protein N0V88_006277 [Collariella sp. IMI 366227]|nr:hypothetical protein N0V88_006277 [Collariella sp. IMI 366227]